ncbi:hypothetical protein GH714_019551 [Hevea brasiliensis]|uniref:Uncharacterized protein n=1 Tax=Hevea brasiliensis TaxID=3981 RepID=A0A6A6MBN6_HEVBR|nr:hypothetical protein GH714_019551 [Hevea brasiliensis]
MEELINKKRVREEAELDFPEVKKIRDDLLSILDESDPDPTTQDLDSVMKSFEEEISASSSPVVVVDLTSDSGESQPELGYLLEASDDELGLPPSSVTSSGEENKNEVTELVRVDSVDSSENGGFWGFDDQIPSYDSFELGVSENYNAEYAAFDDGLFEYSNGEGGPSGTPEGIPSPEVVGDAEDALTRPQMPLPPSFLIPLAHKALMLIWLGITIEDNYDLNGVLAKKILLPDDRRRFNREDDDDLILKMASYNLEALSTT